MKERTIWSKEPMGVGEAVVLPEDRDEKERMYVVVSCEKSWPPKSGWDIRFRAMSEEEKLAFQVMET